MGMKPPSLGLVAATLADLASASALIDQMQDHGWRVHILAADLDARRLAAVRARLNGAGIGFTHLADRAPARELRALDAAEPRCLRTSDRVRWALEELHRRHDFDLIAVPAVDALGFRTAQARRAGGAFSDAGIVVTPPPARADAPETPDEMLLDYCERHTVAQADFVAVEGVRPGDCGWMLERVRSRAAATMFARAVPRPLVTVVVQHRNQPDLLPLALRSLADQTYRNLEVHVIDGGSDAPGVLQAFEQQERQHPGFAFEQDPHTGGEAAHDRLLAETDGEYFLPLAADVILRPAFVEHLVQALHRQPACVGMVCYLLGFHHPADLVRERYTRAARPIGGSFLFGDRWGAGAGLFRTSALRAVGGLSAVANSGREVGVLPEHLGYQLSPAAPDDTLLRRGLQALLRKLPLGAVTPPFLRRAAKRRRSW